MHIAVLRNTQLSDPCVVKSFCLERPPRLTCSTWPERPRDLRERRPGAPETAQLVHESVVLFLKRALHESFNMYHHGSNVYFTVICEARGGYTWKERQSSPAWQTLCTTLRTGWAPPAPPAR